jgi:NAD(P)-dependent dehydrogenase (short-subunit alcohol dehydrogenase family)
MELGGTTTIVTGAASGIGRAIARRFHAEGARVAVVDRDVTGAEAVAAELEALRPASALALGIDVADAEAVAAMVDTVEAHLGPVELAFANAGIGIGTDLETTDADWDLAFAVNVKSHYFLARRLVPGWVARGHGYFCSTASAAGLLSQIGSAPYSVTKHAAVAFAEWLSITYGDRGVRVSCLCPQGVNTNMLNGQGRAAGSVASTGASVVKLAGAVLEPEQVADAVVAAVRAEQFLILPHPEVLGYWQRKTADVDRWLTGMRRLQAKVLGG